MRKKRNSIRPGDEERTGVQERHVFRNGKNAIKGNARTVRVELKHRKEETNRDRAED